MYSYNNKKELKFGGYYLMLNENQDADNYQILLILLILYLMALMFTFIILSNKCKVFRIWKNKFYSCFLLHNFLFCAILCIGIYWTSFYCIIDKMNDLDFNNVNARLIITFVILILYLFVLVTSGILMRIIIEIPFTFLRFYTKKMFGLQEKLNYFEWYFVGLKNEPNALLYHILNCLRKFSYIIPIFGMGASLYFYNFHVNMVYILTLVIISLIEVGWLVYICKVYPYDSLSHNRIIIVNQISVVFILTLGVITIKKM